MRGYCWGTAVYCVVLGAVGGTDRYCWGTAEYDRVLEVLGSNRGYWGIQWSTVRYCWVLIGWVAGYYWPGVRDTNG